MWKILNITFNNVRLEWLHSVCHSVRVKAALGQKPECNVQE